MVELIKGWNIAPWAQFAGIMLAVNTLFMIPAYSLAKYIFQTEVEHSIEKVMIEFNKTNKAEINNIKRAIMEMHPEQVYILYPTRGAMMEVEKPINKTEMVIQ